MRWSGEREARLVARIDEMLELIRDPANRDQVERFRRGLAAFGVTAEELTAHWFPEQG
jgi:hypothetical protein